MATIGNLEHNDWTAFMLIPWVNHNNALKIHDAKIAGQLIKDVNGNANYTLATTGSEPFEWHNAYIKITNTGTAWTAIRDLILPAKSCFYVVENANGTAYSMNVLVSGGVNAVVLPNEIVTLYCDGTDVHVLNKGYNFDNNTVTKTQADTPVALTAADSGQYYDNTGATGAVEFDLPAATKGLSFKFKRVSSQVNTVDPNGTEQFRYKAADGITAAVAGKHLSMDSDGAIVGVECKIDGVWEYTELSGTFTDEA